MYVVDERYALVLGVFTISVDSQLDKVTVIGDVDSETLIKKLVRSGKHAELWPEKNEKKPGKSKKKDGDSNKNSKDGGDQGAANGKANEKSDKPAENESPIYSKDSDDGGENNSLETDGEAGDSKPAGSGGGGNGGGKQKKKKKKKGQNVNAEACKDAPTGTLLLFFFHSWLFQQIESYLERKLLQVPSPTRPLQTLFRPGPPLPQT